MDSCQKKRQVITGVLYGLSGRVDADDGFDYLHAKIFVVRSETSLRVLPLPPR